MEKAVAIGCAWLLAGAMVVAISVVGIPCWVMCAPAVSSSKLARLQIGMSKSEVRKVFGSPDGIYPEHDRVEYWTYSRSTWAVLFVYFDENDRVFHFHHDR